MDRKEFIYSCGVACVGGSMVSLFFQSCASSNYFAKAASDNNLITIKKSEFIRIDKDKKVERKYVLVHLPEVDDKFGYPICVFKIDHDIYSAILMKCSHQSCELNPYGNFLICPCHGSEFTNKGIVQNPPAEQNLKTFITTTDNENIYIKL